MGCPMEPVSLSLVSIEDKQFSAEDLSLDNMRFVNCKFHGCHLLYSGGPFVMDNCRLKNCQWRIQGTAAIVVESLRNAGWQIAPPGGSPERVC